jgi:hypothetical protein
VYRGDDGDNVIVGGGSGGWLREGGGAGAGRGCETHDPAVGHALEEPALELVSAVDDRHRRGAAAEVHPAPIVREVAAHREAPDEVDARPVGVVTPDLEG